MIATQFVNKSSTKIQHLLQHRKLQNAPKRIAGSHYGNPGTRSKLPHALIEHTRPLAQQ